MVTKQTLSLNDFVKVGHVHLKAAQAYTDLDYQEYLGQPKQLTALVAFWPLCSTFLLTHNPIFCIYHHKPGHEPPQQLRDLMHRQDIRRVKVPAEYNMNINSSTQ